MDAFRLHRKVLGDYHDYVRSFIHIQDERIRATVREQVAGGRLWPEPLLQLNPAYEHAGTVESLVREGHLHPDTLRIFRDRDGRPFHLYRHQAQAIEAARAGRPYILTTGTGSGKSLAYFIPIVDHILKNNPANHRVQAIIVYPMNALINSQLEAITRLLGQMPSCPVRAERYTGQEDDQAKNRLQNDPPHILLTNYVMLELMLTRPSERVFVERALADIQFLVLDELHTYTGRQGADVAMLVRRLRQRCGNPDLLCIGTSATMVAGEGAREAQRRKVADVARRLFGVTVEPHDVIDETLRPATDFTIRLSVEALRAAVQRGILADIPYSAFVRNPLAVWVEQTFGIEPDESGFLRRRKPIALEEGAVQLAERTGLSLDVCLAALRNILQLGNRVRDAEGNPVFAFKLHQFISQGGAVYATLEDRSSRYITLEGKNFAAEGRILTPLAFCRICGQEYYQVRWDRDTGRFEPLMPDIADTSTDELISDGYLLLDDPEDPIWSREREEELPDNWYNISQKTGERTSVKKEYKGTIPLRVFVRPDGATVSPAGDGSLPANAQQYWFVPKPFLTCLACGVVYTRREREFRKLAQLSSEGRSTATTLLGISTVSELRQQPEVEKQAAKLLSFTDNRQDASLQAGHFNDFVQVARLRAAIAQALETHERIDHTRIAEYVVDALDIHEEEYAKEVGGTPRAKLANRQSLMKYIEYQVYNDLRRGWRVVQPNLEQAGLMRIEYKDLAETCAEETLWQEHSVLAHATPQERLQAAYDFLDYMRKALAITADCLNPEAQFRLIRDVRASLKELWSFDEDERLTESTWFVLPDAPQMRKGTSVFSLSPATALGRYLRSRSTWSALREDIKTTEYSPLLDAFVTALRAGSYLQYSDEYVALQVRADALIWVRGDGTPPPPDPVRSRWMRDAKKRLGEAEANPFFRRLYSETAQHFTQFEGREHTAQASMVDRLVREERFRTGDLSCLFCSPTMELGIDIADLNTVHLRNVPPTPANYAQRSGRAGRSSQPAVVTTYCAMGNGHDQYFFRRPQQMVAGIVAPPQMDLANEELLLAHIHAMWLAQVRLSLGSSIAETLDINRKGYPLNDNAAHHIQLSEQRLEELFGYCQQVLDDCVPAIDRRRYSDEWLRRVLHEVPCTFDHAFDRWRTMYARAEQQIRDAQLASQSAKSQRERDAAERLRGEAVRQRDLLRNLEGGSQTDFYPYRYLASEGFLPGYNFPRLPIRAYVSAAGDGAYISRSRFLAIREFAPQNILYHEGRKHRVVRSQPVSGELAESLRSAKFCQVCGYYHEKEDLNADVCQNCGTLLSGDNALFTRYLLEMQDAITRQVERITCDEEERLREGYSIDTYFRFKPSMEHTGRVEAVAEQDGDALLHLTYGAAASLWQVNTGWKRNSRGQGFSLNIRTGEWVRGDNLEETKAKTAEGEVIPGIQLMVWDTRNILLVHPGKALLKWIAPEDFEAFLASLQAALLQGIRAVFQVGEREISACRIGKDDGVAILIWEDAEGGLGVLEDLVTDPQAIATVARSALDICHFDQDGRDQRPAGDLENGCAHACYDCLMSYANQWDHTILDRHLLLNPLLALQQAMVTQRTAERDYSGQYQWLCERTDPASELERRFLNFLFEHRLRMPTYAQYAIPELNVQPDFVYADENAVACVFCDGTVHDDPHIREQDAAVRERLQHAGYRVIAIRYDRSFEEQVALHQDIFGKLHE